MIHGKEILPPPTLSRSGQKPPPPPVPSREKPPRPPPPLPARKDSSQNPSQNDQNEPRPALPPRNRPDPPARKLSDSNASASSVATNSTAASKSSTASDASGGSYGRTTLRAPAWGETTLPPLPPKRNTADKKSSDNTTPTRPVCSRSPSSPSYDAHRSSTLPAPRLPPRTNTNGDVKERGPVPLPARAQSSDASDFRPRKVPPPPSRPAVLDRAQAPSLSSLNKLREEKEPGSGSQCNGGGAPSLSKSIARYGREETKPTPPPRPTVPKRLQAPSLETLNGQHEGKEQRVRADDNGENGLSLRNNLGKALQPSQVDQQTPPPVPLSTRPDISKIQATKPRISPPASSPNVPPTSTATGCMICRDFSGPDDHAARFPRQSLPSQDLAWLSMQLTSPFPSPTDKARALFTWLHHNVEYDVVSFFNNNVKPATPESTFSSGLAVCAGYAGLFEKLATHAGLEARTISGHGAGYSHTPWVPGTPLPEFKSTHAWNVVRIDNGYWKLIDTCWGAGNVHGKGKPYEKQFKPEHFIMTNDEFGKRHFPTDPTQFYRDDGRSSITWEEYISQDPKRPGGAEPMIIYSNTVDNYGVGRKTVQPANKDISVHQPGPIRFQFGLICEHWTLKDTPYLYVLGTHGTGDRKVELVPFDYVPGTRPGGGGDMWYLDVPDPRSLGAPGQKLVLYALTSFGDRKGEQARGLTVREFREKYGRTGWGLASVMGWELV